MLEAGCSSGLYTGFGLYLKNLGQTRSAKKKSSVRLSFNTLHKSLVQFANLGANLQNLRVPVSQKKKVYKMTLSLSCLVTIKKGRVFTHGLSSMRVKMKNEKQKK